MIRTLIVDDEIHSTEGIRCSLDWESLGISDVSTANNIQQAKKILSDSKVHILITDIEMPKGSGYDLLDWMRTKGYNPVVIILTSYDKFEYAKKAIEFQCLEYLLKPVSKKDLLDAVQRGIGSIVDRQRADENNKLAEYWNSGLERRMRHFWRDVMDRADIVTSDHIMNLVREAHVPYTIYTSFLPIIYKINSFEEKPTFNTWFDDMSHRIYFQVFQESSIVIWPRDPNIIVISQVDEDSSNDYYEKTVQKSRAFIDWAYEEHEIAVSGHIGSIGKLTETVSELKQLFLASQENITGKKGIFPLKTDGEEIEYKRPEIEKWIDSFNREEYDETVGEIQSHVSLLAETGKIDHSVLWQLLQDFMQELYITLSESNIQAHLLFNDELSAVLYENADKSIKDFSEWIYHLIHKAGDCITNTSDTNSIIGKIKQYIKDNVAQPLSRKQISEHVFLSPDYVSRIFRTKTGIQLNDYITEEKMREARYLLENTELPVGEVAYKTGYYNVAYFSKVFRIRNGVTPTKYRNEIRKNNAG